MAANIEELQTKIRELSPEDFARFQEWFEEYLGKLWDQQFESDVRNGKLDSAAKKALEDFRKGKCSEL